MVFPSVTLKPGPQKLAAALYMAGFSDLVKMPLVIDECGTKWPAPTELQTSLALVGGEASGHAWIWNVNTNGSTDYGALEIDDKAHPEWFGAVTDPAQLNWANYAQNCEMAFRVYEDAGRKFTPWNSFNHGTYLAERYGGKSWMDWAAHGIDLFWSEFNRLGQPPNETLTSFQKFSVIASINLDALEYWVD